MTSSTTTSITTSLTSSDKRQNSPRDATSSGKLSSPLYSIMASSEKLLQKTARTMTSSDGLTYGSMTSLDKLSGVTCGGRRRWTGDMRYMLKMGLHMVRLGARRLSPRQRLANGPMVAVEDGGRAAQAALALCVMYWLVLTYPFTLALTCLGTLLITVLIYLKTLFRTRDCLARLTCRDSTLAHHVTAHCHAFRRALRLPVWARNSHVQSLLGLMARETGVEFRREYLQLADGGLVALDWVAGSQYVPHGRPILIILPDLPASALQMGALCREALKLGLKAVVVNRRGQGGSLVNTPRLPGYGDASDLREVVEFLRHEEDTLSAVGVGTGGDLLLSYLGEFGSSAHLSSAICISPSYSGESTLHSLPAPYSLLYLSHLKRSVLANAKVFGKQAQQARATWTLREFDKRVTCPGGGWEDLDEYWADNEPLREADEISVPLLCVSSMDDPLCGQKHIPHDLFRALPNFFLLTLPHGGHAGFRPTPHGLSWAENAAVDFLLAMLTFPAQHHHKHVTCAHAHTQTDEMMDVMCRTVDSEPTTEVASRMSTETQG